MQPKDHERESITNQREVCALICAFRRSQGFQRKLKDSFSLIDICLKIRVITSIFGDTLEKSTLILNSTSASGLDPAPSSLWSASCNTTSDWEEAGTNDAFAVNSKILILSIIIATKTKSFRKRGKKSWRCIWGWDTCRSQENQSSLSSVSGFGSGNSYLGLVGQGECRNYPTICLSREQNSELPSRNTRVFMQKLNT